MNDVKDKLIELISHTTKIPVATLNEIAKHGGIEAVKQIPLFSKGQLKERSITAPQALMVERMFEFAGYYGGYLAQDIKTIRSPEDSYRILKPIIGYEDREHFVVVGLTVRGGVKDIRTIYKGCTNSISISVKDIFETAIQMKVPRIIVAHNHPSGDTFPSSEDLHATRQIIEAGKVLDIDVVDHVIVGRNGYFSLRDKNAVEF